MEKKVICLPEKSANLTKLESFVYNGCTYLFDTKNNEILEMVTCSENKNSWFINDFVERDGSLTMLTSVDVIYLLLPILMKNRNGFRCLRDLLSQETSWEYVYRCCVKNNIDFSVVTDVKSIDGEDYIKYNCEKALDWLNCKVLIVQDTLFKNQVSTSAKCSQVAGFVSGREKSDQSKEDSLKYAAELILQYIPDELGQQLMKYLKIENVEQLTGVTKVNENDGVKRKLDISAVEDYFDDTEVRKKEETKKAKRKVSKIQKDLEKHKKGTKSITSFFKPKTTTT